MGVAKKGRGKDLQNCSTSSKILYGCQLVIPGEKSFLARSATICKINTVWLPTITSIQLSFTIQYQLGSNGSKIEALGLRCPAESPAVKAEDIIQLL